MRRYAITLCAAACAAFGAMAQDGMPFIHDPSTIAECDGKYYTFGTGGGGLISEDGWTWHSGAERPGRGAAPDVVKIGDRYLVAYSATGGGLGGGHKGQVLTMWNATLDPTSPEFSFSAPIVVAESLDDEDCDAIDAGLLLDPTTGRLWCSYGTYFGFIRLVELDPATGERMPGNEPINIAIDCEATDLVYRDGWYYLLGTHGTCCDGPNSTYNIVVGRSRHVTGPYIDNVGRDMLLGGGKMVKSAEERRFGAGHFGRTVVDDGVEKMSFHFEADLDRGGYSVLAIRPLLWQDGWPVGGDLLDDGLYRIESARRGYALELAVDFQRMELPRRRFWEIDTAAIVPLPGQALVDVEGAWPEGSIPARLGDYMARPHQRWRIEAVPEAGGYLGGQYCKIVVDGTGRALAATEKKEVEVVAAFDGSDSQLWRIEQAVDGTYRIMPKSDETLVLISAGDSTPSLGAWGAWSDNCKWLLRGI